MSPFPSSGCVTESSLVVRKAYYERITMAGEDGGILVVDYAAGLVTVFGDYDFHSAVWEHIHSCRHRSTGLLRDGCLASKEAVHDDIVDPLRCCLGHSHDDGVTGVLEGVEQLVVIQSTGRTQHQGLLQFIIVAG